MNVAAITGTSGSGKSTLIAALIALYRTRGLRVGAIKHTHHAVNEDDRGDTRAFRLAGAEPVILAGEGDAAVHLHGRIARVEWREIADLLARCSGCDIVLIEGFKSVDGGWPRIAISPSDRPQPEEIAARLDRIWATP